VVPFPYVVFYSLLIHPQSGIGRQTRLLDYRGVGGYLSTATNLSSSFKNFVLVGESGMNILKEK
jgi:hypothetical protein